MKNKKYVIARNPKELAISLGLRPLDILEWEVRLKITNKIIETAKKEQFSVTEVARLSGTSRARVTKILKGDTAGISLDVLVRVLGAMGEEIKISFKKAA